jgi:hypothetical protein
MARPRGQIRHRLGYLRPNLAQPQDSSSIYLRSSHFKLQICMYVQCRYVLMFNMIFFQSSVCVPLQSKNGG